MQFYSARQKKERVIPEYYLKLRRIDLGFPLSKGMTLYMLFVLKDQ